MKTQSLTQKVTQTLKYSIAAFVAVLAMTGCGSRSNNNVNPYYNNGFYNGGNCQINGCIGGGGQMQIGAYGQSQLAQVQANFFGQGGAYMGQTGGSYNGQVQIQGTVFLPGNYGNPYMQVCGMGMMGNQMSFTGTGTWEGTSILRSAQVMLNGQPAIMYGYVSTSATSGNMYGLNATIQLVNNPACEITVAY